MATIRVSLRDVPKEFRLIAISTAARGFSGDPADLLVAALIPSEATYPVDAVRYAERLREWKKKGLA